MFFRRPLATISVLVFLLAALSGPGAFAQGCQFDSDRTPASGVPQELWGALKPVDEGVLPDRRDNTDWARATTGAALPSAANPRWMDLSIAGSWIFAGVSHGMQIWDASTPEAPTRVEVVEQPRFPSWPSDPHESFPVRTLAAGPDGNHDVVAVGLASRGGMTVFDTSSKLNPSPLYNDRDKSVEDSYTAEIGGREYLFAATLGDGVLTYDLTDIQNFGAFCSEDTPAGACGVYEGRIDNRLNVRYLAGVGNAAGTRHWIALSSGSSAFGMELWDVSNPAAPVLVLSPFGFGTSSAALIHGLALWREGSAYYLAVRHQNKLEIYDVSCLDAGGCSGPGSPLWTQTHPGQPSDNFLTLSRVGPRPFLHLGNFNRCAATDQNEWLYDLSDPYGPRELTPPSRELNGQLTGYWGWYYPANPTGFNEVAARTGTFLGPYFYRAAFSIFDIHELVDTHLFADGFESGNTSAWDAVSP